MRIDKIDLYGDLRLNGATAGEGQFLGLSGSTLAWLDAAQSTTGFSIYAENFVYCQSVEGSPTNSGINLINAYSEASTLTNISATARGCVLISPGVYDFGSEALGLSLSYIDLVGISSDPYSVTLKSGGSYTLKYYQGVDSGLYNVGLTGGTVLGVLGSASTYLRWGNVVVSGDCFSEQNENYYSFEELNGEFSDILINDGGFFPIAKYKLEGVYKNVKGNPFRSFFADDLISGTFTNINFGNIPSSLFYGSNPLITGYFENISSNSAYFAFCGLTSNGNYYNLNFGDITDSIFNFGHLSINGNDINIDTVGNVALNGNSIDSVLSNLKIGTVSSNTLISNVGSFIGTYSNIKIGSTSNFFKSTGILTGYFDDIEVKHSVDNFYSSDLFSANLSNIDIKNPTGDVFIGSTLSLIAYDINAGANPNPKYCFRSTNGDLKGFYRNIAIGDSPSLSPFNSNKNLDGEFINIEIKNASDSFVSQGSSNINGTFSNFKLGAGNIFQAGGSLSGYFTNFKLGNAGAAFRTTSGTISGEYNQFDVDNLSSNFFYANKDLKANLKNFRLDNLTPAINVFYTDQKMNSSFDNIKMGYVGGNVFSSVDDNYIIANRIEINSDTSTTIFNSINGSIYGTVSNVKLENGNGLFTSANSIFGTYRNLDFNYVGGLFGSTMDGSVRIDRLRTKGFVGSLSGTISNSYIDSRDDATDTVTIDGGATIENCKLISAGGYYSINSTGGTPSCKIYFTTTNNGINGITNLINTPRNLDDSNII